MVIISLSSEEQVRARQFRLDKYGSGRFEDLFKAFEIYVNQNNQSFKKYLTPIKQVKVVK
mgnify:CR=1 FL=1